MGCCRHGQIKAVDNKRLNTNTLCMKCSLDLKNIYYLSAAQQTAGKQGEATVMVTLACPQCSVLNSYVVTIDRKYDRSLIAK